jgi:hypothetical protein
MPVLQTNLNELSKDPPTQLAQVQYALNDIVNLSGQQVSQLLVDYTEPSSATNETTQSTTYVPFKNFTINFTPNNPMCDVIIHMFLQGNGFIGIFFNGLLTQEIYFLNPSASTVPFTKVFQLSANKNKISLQWRANNSNTTLTKVNSPSQPANNSLQIRSQNS